MPDDAVVISGVSSEVDEVGLPPPLVTVLAGKAMFGGETLFIVCGDKCLCSLLFFDSFSPTKVEGVFCIIFCGDSVAYSDGEESGTAVVACCAAKLV